MNTPPPIASSDETGSLGILHLKRYWSIKLTNRLQPASVEPSHDWVKDNTLLGGIRLNLREAAQYIYDQLPSFEQFEQWVLAMNGGAIEQKKIDRLNTALSGTLQPEPLDPKDEVFSRKRWHHGTKTDTSCCTTPCLP